MKNKMLMFLIQMFLAELSHENVKKFADAFLDYIEDFAKNSETKWDDVVLLPLCRVVRSTFDIADED